MSDHRAERELLGAWALDAVDDVERAAVERAIREDPEVAAEARALRESAAMLAAAQAAPPPPGLRDTVLAAVATTPQETAPVARRAGPRHQRWLAAAAVLLAAAVPGTLAVQQAQRAQLAEDQVTAITEALARPGAELLSADVAGGGRAIAVVGGDGAIFTVRDLPNLDGDQDYQLWVIDDGAPVSAGIVRARDGLASTEVAQVPDGAVLAMTVEPAGGSAQPTTAPVVAMPPA
ncbi:anti-sigma factor [Georgenia muralis]